MEKAIEDEILRLRVLGVARSDIAEQLGVSKSTILEVLKRREVPVRRWTRVGPELYRDVMKALQSGLTTKAVAEQFNCSSQTVHAVKSRLGGFCPAAPKADSRKRMCAQDRIEIAIGIAIGLTNTEIAQQIGFDRSNVGREIERNGGRRHYKAALAEQRAQEHCRRPKDFKLVSFVDVREFIESKLSPAAEHYWSPRQIAAGIREKFPDERYKWVSHETIYRSLYIQSRSTLRADLKRCLRTGRSGRKAQVSTVGKGTIVDMINISQRPPEVDDRRVPGHWEGDLIVGQDNNSAIATLVERTTRFVMLAKVDNKTTAAVTAAIGAKIHELPEQLRRSLTWDQGNEMAAHKQFAIDNDIEVYFCDPHSPWQRGSNENTNGLLRQYFPKGTDLSVHSQERLDFVASRLNTRPRETLKFRTPGDLLADLLDKPTEGLLR